MSRFSWFVAPLLLVAAAADADPRPFTFVYDTYPEGKGNVEYEQWVTFRADKPGDHGFGAFDLRHEFELGLADNFDLSFYVANWSWEQGDQRTGTRFDSSSVEAIVYLLNPVTDSIGLGLYTELGIGEKKLSFEPKLLVQKDIGRLTLAYNLVLETEVEDVFTNDKGPADVEGKLEHDFGVSYALTRQWRIGAEATVESVYDNWNRYEGTTVYAGPNLSYQGPHIPGTEWSWWATITPMFQLTNVDEEARFQLRLIAGIEF